MTTIAPFDPADDVVREAAQRFGTPLYLYDAATLRARARAVAAFGGPFGFTPRYAVKANPCRAVLRAFADEGLAFDASTGFEAARVLAAGIDGRRVQVTAQVLRDDIAALAARGVQFTACSLRQIEQLADALPGAEIGLRVNPGRGSGHNNRTSVAGPDASFGVWHEHVAAAAARAAARGLRIVWLHHHVGSGGDPARWAEIAEDTLACVDALPDVTHVNLGGGFKVARMPGETESDLAAAARAADALLRAVAARTGRRLRLEVEPGTWLVATAGVAVGRVHDVVDTGARGRTFVKTDVGMAEVLRPSLYGAQHPVRFVAADVAAPAQPPAPLLVVGPCCESGDLLTPAPGDPETLGPRELPVPRPGDLVVVGAAGAYCAAMATRNYNSIPAAPEIVLAADGTLLPARRRQTLDDVLREEL